MATVDSFRRQAPHLMERSQSDYDTYSASLKRRMSARRDNVAEVSESKKARPMASFPSSREAQASPVSSSMLLRPVTAPSPVESEGGADAVRSLELAAHMSPSPKDRPPFPQGHPTAPVLGQRNAGHSTSERVVEVDRNPKPSFSSSSFSPSPSSRPVAVADRRAFSATINLDRTGSTYTGPSPRRTPQGAALPLPLPHDAINGHGPGYGGARPSTAGTADSLSPRSMSGSWHLARDVSPRIVSSSTQHSAQHYGSSNAGSPPSGYASAGLSALNQAQKTQSGFVGKLFAMLEDAEIQKTGLIQWSPEGTTFVCPNPTEFSKVVLPNFFKHNNWQSFVRQLNMYSFNKVNDLYASSADPQAWEFRHPLFRRGEPHLLASIKRKSTRPNASTEPSATSPIEEDGPRHPVGWAQHAAHPAGPSVTQRLSPPLEQPRRPSVFGWNVGPSGMLQHAQSVPDIHEHVRPPSAGKFWDSSARATQANRIVSHPYHGDARPPLPHAHTLQAIPENTLSASTPPRPWTDRVSALELKVERLTETIGRERVQHARQQLDFVAFLQQQSAWLGSQRAPTAAEARALNETLERAGAESRDKYEKLVASEALATMGGIDAQHARERRLAEPPAYAPRERITLPDPRASDRRSPSGSYFPPQRKDSLVADGPTTLAPIRSPRIVSGASDLSLISIQGKRTRETSEELGRRQRSRSIGLSEVSDQERELVVTEKKEEGDTPKMGLRNLLH